MAPHTLHELSLLLSSLLKYGIDHKSFNLISNEFTHNDAINENLAYDAARLTPESLQSLYLQILKNEIRSAQQHTAQQTKRKKSPTPPLQSLDEAKKHKHLLPGLASKYYDEYVKQIVKEIQDDEKTYLELSKEIETLEKQAQDDLPKKSIDQSSIHDDIMKTTNDVRHESQTTSASGQSTKSGIHPVLPSGNDLSSRIEESVPSHRTNGSQFDLPIHDSTGTQRSGAPVANASIANTSNQSSFPNASFQSSLASSILSNTAQPLVLSSPDTSKRFEQQITNQQQNSPALQNLPADNSTPSNLPPISDSHASPASRPNAFSTPNVKAPWRSQLPAAFTPLPRKLFGNLTTPASLNEMRRIQGLPPIDTSQSSTKWKDLPRNSAKEGRSPPRPSNSPYLSDSPSPEPESRNNTNIPSIETGRATDTPTRGRGRGLPRGRASGVKIGGRSSEFVAASARIRSQSAMSTAEDSTSENIARAFKPEPPTTPGFTDDATSFVSATGDSRASTRRRDLLRDGETPRPVLKRKRADTIDGTPEIPSAPKFSRPGQVLASRNFSRVVSALLNDINSHKLASVFAKPITEKSAPGYQDLIYRPQDLKSIRSAISSGSRFVATIPDPETNTEDNPGEASIATPSTSTTKATNIWIDRVPEVIPPKGIVNSAQLEKELCRMLANAVMYNPDPRRGFGPHFPMVGSRQIEEDETVETQDKHDLDDGRLVNDAREIFASMEQAVAAWRAAERIRPGETANKSAGVDKVEELTEDAAENTGAEDGEGEKSFLRRSNRG